MKNPYWFEDLILFLGIYIMVIGVIIYYFGFRIYKWWDGLKNKRA